MNEVARGCCFGDCVEFHGSYVCDVLPDCGQDVAFKLYVEALEVLNDRGDNSDAAITARWNKFADRFKQGEDERLYYLVLAVFDKARLIEWGVSIRSSWLTPLGEEFLAKAREHWKFRE